MYRRRKVIKEKKPVIPDTIEEFGYRLKSNGEIRSISLELIGNEVEKKLQEEPLNFQKIYIPVGVDPEKEPHSYIYMTPHAMSTPDKVVVLIAGNNTRIGQWSRRIMCDENINSGSMIRMSQDFVAKGYEVIILNPNANFWVEGRAQENLPVHTKQIITIPGSDLAEKHTPYVFHHFIRNVKAEKVAVIAQGWGGHGFACALNNEVDFIKSHVKGVAFIDSAHSKGMIEEGEGRRNFLFERCVNWSSDPSTPKGQPINDVRWSCQGISSEQEVSDFTLPTMYDDIMKFIFIKMGDIEPPPSDDENDEDDIQDLTAEEAQAIEGITIDAE
ncbi:Arb2 domain-containing protein [Mycotypha africana]|uniref:Arb2 domain-containing protein n=1 Tax=Mycotypha africana TaxID=64632 RepID=UPI0022FFE1B4|nr:Arb2 domain-containing protein [Mycotypha africana]KAI8988306.1 Arb2 domain-containing protein [Mycotypha africana]